ncbi:NAD(P)-dependent oxidoreductase [Loigolactobacillus zhaoyuanensis]|uniref:NAD(P)-dependent oxidoreductase n=1 Tax=Loigolactobacillus zhaoyuanensis TaxID=2486017 RepID=UPI000F749A2C|nr:NAD(P)-dependent oxidoreductase [Loigolactobacillus zhaoyuanensis]
MQKIGFIGTGVMGTGIINNLLKANFAVTVYNRTKAHADTVLANGATWADSPRLVAQNSDITITMVGYPQDVEAVYYGDDGVFAGVKSGSIVVDMTTSTPTLAQRIAATAITRDVQALDAPVSGGDIGAKNGTLTIMVGGAESTYDQLVPLFKAIGQSYHLFGAAGKGQHAKMANQIMIAGTMTGMSEMLVYAKQVGLDLSAVIETVGAGSAANWSLTNYAPRILAKDYSAGFFAKHFLKDLRIALDEAKKQELDLPATKAAAELYRRLVEDHGFGDDGTQALVKLWWPTK